MRGFRVGAALALTCCAPLMQANVDRLDRFAERVLAAHNRERAAVSVPALLWDRTLAAEALARARHIASTGRFEHANETGTPISGRGENLWEGTSGRYALEEMISDWSDERADFLSGVFPNVSRSHDLGEVAHYTQMIWRGSTRVGCAVADDGRHEILVCRYVAPGNVMGERPI